MVQQPLVGQGPLVIEVSQSHSETPHSVGLLWTGDQLDAGTSADSTQHSQETDIHARVGVRTRNPIKQEAADHHHPRYIHTYKLNSCHRHQSWLIIIKIILNSKRDSIIYVLWPKWKLLFCHKAEKIIPKQPLAVYFKPYKFGILRVFNQISVYPLFAERTTKPPATIHSSCCVGDAMGDCVGLVDEDRDISARRRAMGRVELVAAVAGLKLNRGGLWRDGPKRKDDIALAATRDLMERSVVTVCSADVADRPDAGWLLFISPFCNVRVTYSGFTNYTVSVVADALLEPKSSSKCDGRLSPQWNRCCSSFGLWCGVIL